MGNLIDIGFLLTYLMIGTASICILTDKYWKYFMMAWGLMLLDVALMVFGFYTFVGLNFVTLLIPPIIWLSFICLVILCPVIMALMDKNKRISALYKFGGSLAIFAIAYLMASDEVLGFITVDEYSVPEVKNEITASTAKEVGMGLNTFYILAIGAVGAVLYAELSKVFSK